MRRASFALVLVLVAAPAVAGGPLHEYVPPDPREDAMLGPTAVGDLPLAIDTPQGQVSAPDPFRLPSAAEKAYSRSQAPEGNAFTPDRDTRPVQTVDYDDPFSPSIAPFKRLSAFDAVNADESMRVADAALRPLPTGGVAASGEDAFFADLTVDLVAGEAVRIPSVGPSARLLKLVTVPETPVSTFRDGAENWFVRGKTSGRVRLLLHTSVPRTSLSGALADRPLSDLPPAPKLPERLAAAAQDVNRAIGVHSGMGLKEAVAKLVAYYRSFVTTTSPLPQKGEIFRDLAESKKGVCRHRSYAFVVSALALRIPARLVTNEAHAWVEVSDGLGFHRIDLGGAAENFDDTTSADKPQHKPPDDPFAWPQGSRPGTEVSSRTQPGGTASASSSSTGRAPTSVPAPGERAPGDDRPGSVLTLAVAETDLRRNELVHLEGRVTSDGGACTYVPLDVFLGSDRERTKLGSLATDRDGRYSGAVIVPASVALGTYELFVSTPGDLRCGPGRSEP